MHLSVAVLFMITSLMLNEFVKGLLLLKKNMLQYFLCLLV